MESYIPISYLKDFVFCPRSIYFQQLYGKVSTRLYKDRAQTAGLNAHKTVDNKTYSSAKKYFQGIEIYSEKYKLCGKIDTYNQSTGELVERKKKIKTIYDGYIFQVYAQYFCLIDMGYKISSLSLYSMDDNKKYKMAKPEDDQAMLSKFESLLDKLKSFELEAPFSANANKCKNCIYNNLCDEALLC